MQRRFRQWRCILVAAGLLLAYPATAQEARSGSPPAVIDIAGHVRDAAQRFGIPESWIWAVMRVESGGKISATSLVGAMGLMQVMPATWANLTARHSLGDNAYDPRANIMAGAAYLRQMHDRYGSTGFLAAYNAGPGRYEQYLRGARGLPAETRNYVAKLAPMISGGAVSQNISSIPSDAPKPPPLRPSWTQASLFAVRSPALDDADDVPPSVTPSSPRAASSAPVNGLFAPISGRSSQ